MKLFQILQLIDNIALSNGFSVPWLVGGLPRDIYLNKLENINDIDITNGDSSISFLAKETAIALKDLKPIYRLMEDGHSRIIINNIKIDFSSNFVLPNIDKIIPNSSNIKKEIFSRDFTCNTLLMSMSLNEIKDITGQAIKDIDNKIIKCCLSPEITLASDPKRIPRLIYLACKLDFEIQDDIKEWVLSNKEVVRSINHEYFVKKINKSIDYNKEKTFKLLKELNLSDFAIKGIK